MGTLKVTGLAKSFGIDELFRDVSFEVTRGDKVGFVGANGAGKSTLMRCLMGQEEVDAGEIRWDTNDTIGYVEQTAAFHGGTLYEEFRSAFDDIIALGAKKAALEQELKRAQDEETLAAYSRTLNRFESLGGYDYESRLRRVAGRAGRSRGGRSSHFSNGRQRGWPRCNCFQVARRPSGDTQLLRNNPWDLQSNGSDGFIPSL